jgi:hypothetical protein
MNDVQQRGPKLLVTRIFDPADPNPPIRLVPEPRGPIDEERLSFGGQVPLTNDPLVISVDAFKPGDAAIQTTNGRSASALAVEVRAPKLGSFPGKQTAPLTKTRPGSQFISEKGQDSSGVPGGITGGRPVNPKGTGRKINIGGEGRHPASRTIRTT